MRAGVMLGREHLPGKSSSRVMGARTAQVRRRWLLCKGEQRQLCIQRAGLGAGEMGDAQTHLNEAACRHNIEAVNGSSTEIETQFL